MTANIQISRAPLSKRIGAFFIDYLIICFIMAVAGIIGGSGFFQWIMIIVGFIFLLKDSNQGISPGRKIVNLAVRDAKDNTKIPSFLKLVARNLIVFFWPVELLIMLVDKENRRLGDMLTGTEVVLINRDQSVSEHQSI